MAVSTDKLIPGIALDGPFIRVDRRMAASLPLLYACGDCAGKPVRSMEDAAGVLPAVSSLLGAD